jgi:hypothetical protein
MKLKANWRIAALALFVALQLQTVAKAEPPDSAPAQHFVCNIGYTQKQCEVDMAALRKALAKYPVDGLGEWTWVLVRSEDWKRILLDRGFDPNNPAFSYLPQRETFFDGSLVVKVSTRGVELSGRWHMPIEDLLDLAIRHEIAHALCNERNEAIANRAATALKDGKPLSCQATLVAKNRTDETRKRQ